MGIGPFSIYNTLTRRIEVFQPSDPLRVSLYTCGPTVYGPGHLGHARSYINFDLLKRTLKFFGFQPRHVLNITDIHDDVIKKARQEKVTIFELADRYTNLFFQDLKNLNILPADVYPRVAENIPEIIAMVQTLIGKGFAYVERDGSVYFDISEFPNYGKLSGIKVDQLVTGTRVDTDKYEREEVSDFALWKAWKKGEPYWESPWGRGRPGWHIECSVMSKKYLGETLDIHAGAVDLKFPHHENEIAQSEAANGVPLARYWVHGGLLQIEGQKMSKSLGNYFEINQITDKGFDFFDLRYLFLTAHYRSEMNFTWDGLNAAKTALKKLSQEVVDLQEKDSGQSPPRKDYLDELTKNLSNDLNIPESLSLLWRLMKDSQVSPGEKLATLNIFDRVFGLNLLKTRPIEIPMAIKQMVNQREKMRQEGKWPEADKSRRQIEDLGYLIEDTDAGPKVRVK